MNEHPNIALHRKAHEAFNRSDMDTLSNMIAEDTVWHWPGRSQISGDHRGRNAVFEQFGKMAELTGGNTNLEAQDYLASNTKSAALFQFTATRGDKQLDILVCEVAEWRDEKVAEEWLFIRDLYAHDDFWS